MTLSLAVLALRSPDSVRAPRAGEALHKSESRSAVDDDGPTSSSAGQQSCCPVAHPPFERHG